MMCPVVAGFLSNPRSTIADLLATSAGYNGSMDRLAEEFAYVREAKNGCFEVLPHALEEPLLVLQSTGEIVGQAGEVGAEFFRVVMGAKMEGWDGVVKEWMEKGLGSAEAVIGKMRDKAKAGVSFWVEQIEDEDL